MVHTTPESSSQSELTMVFGVKIIVFGVTEDKSVVKNVE